jgi:ribulose-phosphate 3-epimerase
MRTTPAQLIASGAMLSVGILAGDCLRLGEELEALESAGVGIIHVDVMDGVFCPMATVAGPTLVEALPARFVKDVHLMIDDPLGKVDAYVDAAADIITFHIEATRHAHRVLQSLDGTGVLRGVALNPGTALALVDPLLDDLELILLLAVNPGWSQQKFIPSTERRISELRARLDGREVVLAVDGAITKENVDRIASLGVDLLVAGSAVFKDQAPRQNATAMLASLERARVAELRGS